MAKDDVKQVKRRIHFFRADLGTETSGLPVAATPREWLRDLRKLGFCEDESSRYLPIEDGDVLWVNELHQSNHPALQFCRSRRSALPQRERKGQISDLGIQPDEGLVEPAHVVFFPNNVVGVEYNHFGPRISLLPYYLDRKLGGQPTQFRPLLRENVEDILDRLLDLRVLEFNIDRSTIESLESIDQSLASAFNANRDLVTGQERISVVLKFERADQTGALRRFAAMIRHLLGSDDGPGNVKKLSARGKLLDTNRVQTIDFLSDFVVFESKFLCVSPRSRAIESGSALAVIEGVYSANKELLERAPSMGM